LCIWCFFKKNNGVAASRTWAEETLRFLQIGVYKANGPRSRNLKTPGFFLLAIATSLSSSVALLVRLFSHLRTTPNLDLHQHFAGFFEVQQSRQFPGDLLIDKSANDGKRSGSSGAPRLRDQGRPVPKREVISGPMVGDAAENQTPGWRFPSTRLGPFLRFDGRREFIPAKRPTIAFEHNCQVPSSSCPGVHQFFQDRAAMQGPPPPAMVWRQVVSNNRSRQTRFCSPGSSNSRQSRTGPHLNRFSNQGVEFESLILGQPAKRQQRGGDSVKIPLPLFDFGSGPGPKSTIIHGRRSCNA